MEKQEIARVLYREIMKIHELPVDEVERLSRFYNWLNKLFFFYTKDENLQFTTYFARISFAGHQYKISPDLQWRIHHFRKLAQQIFYHDRALKDLEYFASLKILAECVSVLNEVGIPQDLIELFPKETVFVRNNQSIVAHRTNLRVHIVDLDIENQILKGRAENEDYEDYIYIRYGETGINDLFQKVGKQIQQLWKKQVTVNLIDISIDDQGIHFPKIIVLEPDYLFDVTAIAECFQPTVSEPLFFLLKKFLPFKPSVPLMLGNIANFFLDELMQNVEAKFEDIFPQCFTMNPLAFTLFNDHEIKDIMQQARVHFFNLKKQIKEEFPQRGIEVNACFLEPSFYSEKFGIQGRLDVYHHDLKNSKHAIIELKSGSPYGANKYGLSRNHYTQTLLYDLLIKSVYGLDKDPEKYILYSKIQDQNLKFAPSLKLQQQEALQIRNQLMSNEKKLIALNHKDYAKSCVIDLIQPQNFPEIRGFLKKDIQFFASVISGINALERAYFLSYISFIAQEHYLAKTGMQGIDKLNGLASLWLNPFREKEENFEIISHLKLIENQASAADPILCFIKTEKTNPLANFRAGDIAVLYPANKISDTVLDNQIFKCNVLKIENEKIHIKLRSKQFNNIIFDQHEFWNIEHDLIDSSFTHLYRNLFSFLQEPVHLKNRILGISPPEEMPLQSFNFSPGLSEEQQKILTKALSSKDYFLLVGPPGTGKTKFMLREMVRYCLQETDQQILLLAYTNRAVDEICEAIDDFAQSDYFRIGSKSATGKAFQDRLLNSKIAGIKSRKALKEMILKHRIVVSTLSSMNSRADLHQLKKFDTVIIDEASQILEPMLLGLLPKVKRFILIGDHKQLPAVVMQDKKTSAVKDEKLRSIGLINRRNALFERLFLLCKEKNYHWAYDMLSHQGRMHKDISAFPNENFYHGELKLLPKACDLEGWQHAPLSLTPLSDDPIDLMISKYRLFYISTEIDEANGNRKTNEDEAQKAALLCQKFLDTYEKNDQELKPNEIGIITPYRAQIAQIRKALNTLSPAFKDITIDTVERYQGGARKVIIISLCLNTISQLSGLVSLSDDGKVDRKLNVALTRARHHLVILGNEALLNQQEIYAKLIASIAR